jgi:hypothetical protein
VRIENNFRAYVSAVDVNAKILVISLSTIGELKAMSPHSDRIQKSVRLASSPASIEAYICSWCDVAKIEGRELSS